MARSSVINIIGKINKLLLGTADSESREQDRTEQDKIMKRLFQKQTCKYYRKNSKVIIINL